MKPSLREDFLEAILNHTRRYSSPPGAEDLSNGLAIDIGNVQAHLRELALRGDVVVDVKGAITLTDQGIATGNQILKKHETLQCFLSEILGMDTSAASVEACKIEHAVSDETIDRLGNYIRTPFPQSPDIQGVKTTKFCPGRGQGNGSCGYAQSLGDFKEGQRLIVKDILGRGCSKRLLDLGVVPGEIVVIKRKLGNRSIVVQVKDCDVALSPEIASAICVEPAP
jgi:DtxR family Mn-dependent transcriptional regulator